MNDTGTERTGTRADDEDDASLAGDSIAGPAMPSPSPLPAPPEHGAPMVSVALTSSGLRMAPVADDAVPPYVRRAMAGDTRAFGELYQLHRRDVARLSARLLGPRGDLDDLIQEVFIQVFRSLPNFRAESRFTTWLHRVTVNVALMHLRALKSRPQLGYELPSEMATPDAESPLDGVARNERMRALYKILDEISDKKRTVFILHDLEGVPAADIATVVGSPVLTVRTRLFYARQEVYAAMANDPALDGIAKQMHEAASKTGAR